MHTGQRTVLHSQRTWRGVNPLAIAASAVVGQVNSLVMVFRLARFVLYWTAYHALWRASNGHDCRGAPEKGASFHVRSPVSGTGGIVRAPRAQAVSGTFSGDKILP